MKKMFRQGDVLLVEVASLPNDAKPANNVVAYGEYSGHHHIVKNGTVLESENENEKFVIANKKTVLAHEKNGVLAEHLPIEVPEGTYKIVMQRQYNPLEGWRKVLD